MPEAPTGVDCATRPWSDSPEGGTAPLPRSCRRHRDVAYRVALRLLGHHDDWRLDAVQDGFIKAHPDLDDFDGRSGFRTWLLRIVYNAAIDSGDEHRRPAVRLGDGEDNGPEPAFEDDPARGLNQSDLRKALDTALNCLTPPIRATFVLFAEAGLSYKAIAEAQNVPIGTVMSRLHYARQKLQSFLNLNELEGT